MKQDTKDALREMVTEIGKLREAIEELQSKPTTCYCTCGHNQVIPWWQQPGNGYTSPTITWCGTI